MNYGNSASCVSSYVMAMDSMSFRWTFNELKHNSFYTPWEFIWFWLEAIVLGGGDRGNNRECEKGSSGRV